MSVSPTLQGVDLNDDTLLHIRSFLSGSDRISFDSTCRTFNSLSTHFDKALKSLIERLIRLVPDNAAIGAMNLLQYDKYVLVRDNCSQEIDALFRLFKKRLLELKVPLFSKKHPKLFEELFFYPRVSLLQAHLLSASLFRDPILTELLLRSFEEVRLIYVNLPIDEITVEGMEKVEKLARSLRKLFSPAHRREFLKEIALKHPLQRIEALRLEYSNYAPDSPRFLAVQERIRLKLIRKKEKIEAKLADIETKQEAAEVKYRMAKTAMDQSYQRLLEICPASLIGDSQLSEDKLFQFIERLRSAKEAGQLVGEQLACFDDFLNKANYFRGTDFFDGIIQPWSPEADGIRRDLQGIMDRLKPENIELAARESMAKNAAFFQEIKELALEDVDS